jgi:pectin methylesterase-like acyl-CoA thioesterase
VTILTVGTGGAYSSIQLAVNAAVNGDTISVAAGTYTEDVTVTGKSITIDGDESGGAVNLNGQITVAGTLNGALAISISMPPTNPMASWSRPVPPALRAR